MNRTVKLTSNRDSEPEVMVSWIVAKTRKKIDGERRMGKEEDREERRGRKEQNKERKNGKKAGTMSSCLKQYLQLRGNKAVYIYICSLGEALSW